MNIRSDSDEDPPHPRAAFQSRDFRFFQAARFLALLAWLMQTTAIGYQVYSITGKALDLGYVGLAFFLPNLLFAPFTGHVADKFDRRRVMLICMALLMLCSGALFAIARVPHPQIWWIYLTLVVTGTAHAFYGPASQAMMPQLVPVRDFANAVAWNSTIWQGAAILGPAIGGLIYDQLGPSGVYGADCMATGLAFVMMAQINVRWKPDAVEETSWQTLAAGLRFIWQRPIIFGAISMDLFAVLLGGATALLPIYAKDILQVDETGFGLMRSAPAIGAALAALALAHMPPLRRAGAVMMWSVIFFGAATIVFGLSNSFMLSLVMLFIMGVTDMASVVVRHTLVQIMTPNEMRGRVSAVNLVFIGASNELGEFESGVTAHWFGSPVTSVVVGGVGTILIVVIWAYFFPSLRKVDRLDQALLDPKEKADITEEREKTSVLG